MAPELKSKKRKSAGAEEKAVEPKKVKQAKAEVPAKKRKAAEETATNPPKKTKPEPETVKKSTKSKKTAAVEPAPTAEPEKPKAKKETAAKSAASKKSKAAAAKEEDPPIQQAIAEAVAEEDDDSSDEEIDDQTQALLTGFESDEDEADGKKEDEGFEHGQKVPTLPNKLTKAAKSANASENEGPGTLYIGRIPHGFYEDEMRQYFSQFGDISRLRLSRNQKTGASKHFAFIEFKSAEVAEITAKAMDNYLLFGHILKVKQVSQEQVHPDLWKGANKRFKKVPWNKLAARKLEEGKTEAGWTEAIEKEEARRQAKAEKLAAIGYDFPQPKIKSAKGMPKTARPAIKSSAEKKPEAIDQGLLDLEDNLEKPRKKTKKEKAAAAAALEAENETKAIEAAPEKKEAESEPAQVTPSVPKKGKKTKAAEPVVEEAAPTEASEPAAEPAAEKPKKGKKAKAAEPIEEPTPAEVPEAAPAKKSKKAKAAAPEAKEAESEEAPKKTRGRKALEPEKPTRSSSRKRKST